MRMFLLASVALTVASLGCRTRPAPQPQLTPAEQAAQAACVGADGGWRCNGQKVQAPPP